MAQEIERFLDEEGRVKSWPAKKAAQEEVYRYLAGKFERNRDFSEREVNAILVDWHTFEDLFILRRGLISSGWMKRETNGSRYWRNPGKRVEERV